MAGDPEYPGNFLANPLSQFLRPAGLEEMFFKVGQPIEASALSAPPPDKEEIERLLHFAPQYGVEIVSPAR